MVSHQERYDRWAPDYNKDVAKRNYDGPQYIVNYLMELKDKGIIAIEPTPEFKVIDVGCGSGLVGQALRNHSYHHIDGMDLSQGMIVEAKKTGAYQTLIGWQDLNYPLPFFLQGQYDLTVCCGVFALDFVKPESLQWLVQVTKLGGIVVLSTKTTYYDTYNFEGYYQQLQTEGKIQLLDCRMNQPYLGSEADGHYWVFSVKNH